MQTHSAGEADLPCLAGCFAPPGAIGDLWPQGRANETSRQHRNDAK